MLQMSEEGLNSGGDLGITLHYLHDLEKLMSCGPTAQTHAKQRSSHLPKLPLSELLLISPLIAGLL